MLVTSFPLDVPGPLLIGDEMGVYERTLGQTSSTQTSCPMSVKSENWCECYCLCHVCYVRTASVVTLSLSGIDIHEYSHSTLVKRACNLILGICMYVRT